MKSRSFLPRHARFAALFVLLLASVTQAEPPATEMSRIAVQVGPLRNGRGSLGCRLYTSPDGFPRTSKGTQSARVKVTGTSARCVFENLKPGTYAVTVHHDENDNGKFDTNILGVPVEGYGVSNNHTYALRAPRWDESKVHVALGKQLTLGIAVRY
jgi:uncharacterized protein (DUF2141 family)